MRLPGDVVFSVGALLMGWDFIVKLMQPVGGVREPKAPVAVPAE